ncbi:hypothetical protein [Kitasatospora sp. NPDC101183]|uniref:hypothetical protein n=1 Tax=Kitasatospora sp. NPDC101183 TaxID=3364100 RepID=UPI0037F15F1F
MRGFGFTARPTIAVGLDEAPVTRLTRSGVYGYFDIAKASAKGYDRFREMPPEPAGAVPLSKDEQSALTGNDPTTHQPATSVGGKPVPPGGCNGKARETFKSDEFSIDDSALPDGGPKVPPSDPRLKAAYAAWSTCMKGKGFDYRDPVAAIGDPRWHDSRTATTAEIATATADIDCKLSNNTVGVVVAVQTAYDKKYIEANTAELAAYRQRTEDLLRRAGQAAAGQNG